MLWDGEFRYKVCQCLSFHGCTGGVSYIKLTELNSLLYHPTSDFRFIHRFLNGLIRHHYDRVSLEV